MKIYVGMLAYNAELYIEAALRSVYDYVDEVIVVDGSPAGLSTDRTVEIARSVGPKIRLFQGEFSFTNTENGKTWRNVWNETRQRQTYIDLAEKDENNWLILHDADEVFDDENIQRLIEYAKRAPLETKLLSYRWMHFWRDPWHVITGEDWDKPRWVGMFRLDPRVRQLNINTIGIEGGSNWTQEGYPVKVVLDDVFFYHYGHVSTFERYEFKVKCFFGQGFWKENFEPHEWERYKREVLIPGWNKGINIPDVLPYAGEHPEEIRHLLPVMEKLWRQV